MKILISGSAGFVGSFAEVQLSLAGHETWRLVRHAPRSAREVPWNPDCGELPAEPLEGFDAVIHLAGEHLAAGRWTAARKQRIRNSRVTGTHLLAGRLARLRQPPKVLLSASATGIYGSRGGELLSEESAPGDDFLARVCRDWEAATQPAAAAGIRVVCLRFGVILSPRGGALAKMLPVFNLGLGGPLGGGRQYWSWVSLDDAAGAMQHALFTGSLRGPVNVVAPGPVTNREFTRALGRALGRPAVLPAPGFVLRLLFGEMAGATLLAGARVQPERLLGTRFEFRHAELEPALRDLLEQRGA